MILGIDEVGRGPYAGPLVIGACILPNPEIIEREPEKYAWIFELTDSKKLTVKKREILYNKIRGGALAVATGWVEASEIDKIGLSASLRLACRRAIKQIQETHIPFSEIIIDGTMNFLIGTPLEKYVSILKKGDLLIKEISAASILAKVERDRYMKKLAEKYPKYGFEKHVGYGTALHQRAMEQYGLTPEHRRSFRPVHEILIKQSGSIKDKRLIRQKNLSQCEKVEDDSEQKAENIKAGIITTSTELGKLGEEKVAEYLIFKGHEIVAKNFKTKYFEIDIISRLDDSLFFTEVKYRKTAKYGEPIEFINKRKQGQMRFAADSFLVIHPEFKNHKVYLAAAGVSGEDFQIEDWLTIE